MITNLTKKERLENQKTFENWIEKMEQRGYKIYKKGKCSVCGEEAVSMISSCVIHAKCSQCNWSDSGFGGPSVHSWGEAVRRTYGEKGARFVEAEKRAGRY